MCRVIQQFEKIIPKISEGLIRKWIMNSLLPIKTSPKIHRIVTLQRLTFRN